MLNEFLKEHRQVQDLKGIVAEQQKQIETLHGGGCKKSASSLNRADRHRMRSFRMSKANYRCAILTVFAAMIASGKRRHCEALRAKL